MGRDPGATCHTPTSCTTMPGPRTWRPIREWLAEHDILLAGRYSEWEYYNSDHAFLAGKKAAERVRELRQADARAVAV